MIKHLLLAGLALGALSLGAGANAAAPLLQMKLTSGAATTGVLTEGASGVVTYVGALGNFTLNVTNGFGATAGLGQTIDLASFNATAAAAGTLTMMLTETNLTGALNPNDLPQQHFRSIGHQRRDAHHPQLHDLHRRLEHRVRDDDRGWPHPELQRSQRWPHRCLVRHGTRRRRSSEPPRPAPCSPKRWS